VTNDSSTLGTCIQAGALTTQDRRHDARTGRLVVSCLPVAQAGPVSSVVLQFASQVRDRAEDQGFNERRLSFLLEGLLALEQRPQLLGLQVGGDQRVIDRA
jgi:hypothetical protein